MFEFQTAISELTGLPVANASVYEGPSAVAAAGYMAKLETRRTRLVASRGASSALARRAAHPRGRLRHGGGGGPADRRRRHRRRGALAAAVDDDTAAVFVQQPNFLGTVEDLGELAEAGKRTGALLVVRRRPAPARHPPAAGRARRRHLRGRGPDARQPAGLRRPELRLLRRGGALHPPDAGPDRRRDARRGRAARLRAHAPDPRAAHPAREGHAQHLHGPGAERPGRRGLPVVARQARARGARRADAAPHPLRPRGARARADQPGPGGARVRRARAGPGRPVRARPRAPASTRATGSGATTPSTRTGCWWPSPSAARARTSTAWPSWWTRRERAREKEAVR